MVNKKGDLTKEGLEIILAVVAIVLVVVVVGLLWNAFVNSEDQNAKKTMGFIEAKINALKAGENNTFIVQGFSGAENWIIVGWNKSEPGRPDACYFKGCLCICKQVGTGELIKSSDKNIIAKDCTAKGFCRTFNLDDIHTYTLRPKSSYPFHPEYIHLAKNLIAIDVNRTSNMIDILYNDYSE